MQKINFIFALLLLATAANAQRNTLLIIADDLGTDYFGFNEDHVDTVDVPNIRALMARGVRFKNLMSNPVCSSTRTTILTGRYSFRTGVGGIVGGAGGSNQIDTGEVTIPRLLRKHNTNIAKANIGKWHLKQPMPAINLQSPLIMGYDYTEGPFIGQLPSFTNWTKYTNGVASTVTNYATSENVNNAVSWLKTQQASKPFFIWLAFNAPHDPLHLPPAGLHSFTTLSGAAADITANPKAYFKADIQALDHEIGRLLDSLRTLNRLDSTDIIFIGDNGNTPRTAQIADLNKAKGTVYQYGVHVPLIIAGPAVVNPGRASDALVNTAVIFATIIENFGYTNWRTQIPANKPVDSRSVLPILKNVTDSVRAWSYCEIFRLTPDGTDGKAMRNRNYKLIRFDVNGSEEFYDLANDPLENNNRLLGTLTLTESLNYTYLCNEMSNLVGTISFCNPAFVATASAENASVNALQKQVYPNPFSAYIYFKTDQSAQFFELSNVLGQNVFSGKNIDKTDFSYLPKGVYFLKSKTETAKLIKE